MVKEMLRPGYPDLDQQKSWLRMREITGREMMNGNCGLGFSCSRLYLSNIPLTFLRYFSYSSQALVLRLSQLKAGMADPSGTDGQLLWYSL
jgi:hypothetical protein